MGYRELRTGAKKAPRRLTWRLAVASGTASGFVQLFIEVPDIDKSIAKATAVLGAKTLVPKSVLPDGDCMAILLDPTGISSNLGQS